MKLQASPSSVGQFAPFRHAVSIDKLAVRHLRTRSEIEEILHLRDGIDLSVHCAAGSNFIAAEKKEMNVASLALSSCRVR